ncbi:putative phosphatidate phosphatase [Diaphorina citri]|uniref:Phosphatidate phosphatase n=1 Tax=Diaphorina citri TaxID=121845 RepID=A0A1S3DGH5_DIACI|nr:putative phosphatidate phosphatase [Diaphorina citri]
MSLSEMADPTRTFPSPPESDVSEPEALSRSELKTQLCSLTKEQLRELLCDVLERNPTLMDEIVSVGFTVLLLAVFGQPSKQGFFCSDTSIRYPFKESTVSTGLLACISLSLPNIIVNLLFFMRLVYVNFLLHLKAAWYTSLTRVLDNMHHWTDVLAGALIGITFALLIINYVEPPRPRLDPEIIEELRRANALPAELWTSSDEETQQSAVVSDLENGISALARVDRSVVNV